MNYVSRFTPLYGSAPQMDSVKKVYGFRLLRFFSVILMMLASFVSCKKENNGMDATSMGNDSPSEAVVADRTDSADYWLGLVINQNGILAFQNDHHLKKVLEILESQYLATQENFSMACNGLTEAQIDALAASTGYNPEASLINFEQSKSFTSQRAAITQAATAWRQAETVDAANSPYQNKVLSPVLGAMINNNGQYAINGQVHRIEFSAPDGMLCLPMGYKVASVSYGGNKRAMMEIQLVQAIPIGSHVTTKATNLKKVLFGYGPSFTQLGVNHGLSPFNINCSQRMAAGFDGKPQIWTFTRQVTTWGFFPNYWFQQTGTLEFLGNGVFGTGPTTYPVGL